MRIGVFMHDLSSGGAEKILVEYLNYLCENTDDEIFLILAQKKGPYLSIVNPKVTIVSLNQSRTISSIMPLYKYLKHNKLDILYSTLINANLIATVIGRLLGIRIIIREANTIEVYRSTKKKFIDTLSTHLTKYVYKYIYKCIAISENVKKDLVTYTNCPPEKIYVIYNPIIIIDDLPEVKLDQYFHIGLVSRLSTQKNIPTICKIIERLAASDYKIVFHFFGEGRDSVLIEEVIKTLKGNLSVILHGFNLSYYSYIKHMQLFMHLPLWEGLGNSVLEVYNSGIPMVLSNVQSGYSELIKPEYPNVHYFDPLNSIDDIVQIIDDYYNNRIPVKKDREKLNLSKNDIYKAYRNLIPD